MQNNNFTRFLCEFKEYIKTLKLTNTRKVIKLSNCTMNSLKKSNICFFNHNFILMKCIYPNSVSF